MDTLETLRQAWAGASGLEVSLLIAVGTWVQEDLTLAGAGVLSGSGEISLVACFIGAVCGIIAGDNITYALGRYFGGRVLEWSPVKRLTGGHAGRGRALFESRGKAFVFTSRFIPGSRAATYLLAGSMGMPWRRFFLVTALAACLWAPFVILAARFVGTRVITGFEAVGANPLIAAGCGVLLLFVVLKSVQALTSRRAASDG